MSYANGILNPGFGQCKTVAGLNRLMEFQLRSPINWISNDNIHRFASTQSNHTLSHRLPYMPYMCKIYKSA